MVKKFLTAVTLVAVSACGVSGQQGSALHDDSGTALDQQESANLSVEQLAGDLEKNTTYFGKSFRAALEYIGANNLNLLAEASKISPAANDGVRFSGTLTYWPEDTGGFGQSFSTVTVSVSFMKLENGIKYTSYSIKEETIRNIQPNR